jgi:ABC-type multidrug transport system ATPase subunit
MSEDCYTLLWAPSGDAVARNIVQNIMANNAPAISAGRVKEFASADDANAWMQADGNYGRTLGVYEFFVDYTLQNIDFGIQIVRAPRLGRCRLRQRTRARLLTRRVPRARQNATLKSLRGQIQDDSVLALLPMQVAAEREITRYLGAVSGGGASFGAAVSPAQAAAIVPSWDITLAQFPHPAESSFSLVGVIAPTFLLAAAMFVFTIQVFNVVLERELKLRSSMRVMGVSDGVWWLSWVLWELCFTNIISSLLICAFGNAFPFDLFRRNQFSVVFIHFWLFEASLTALGYFLSTFVNKANGSTFVGFTIFLFGFIFQLVVTIGGVPFTTAYGGPEYGADSVDGKYRALQVIFSLFPPTVFAKGISDLGIATATDSLSGIKWRTRDSYCYCNPAWLTAPTGANAPPSPLDFTYIYGEKKVSRNSFVCSKQDYQDNRAMFPNGDCDYSINECWQWLILDFGIYMLLALYFDKVKADEFGVSQHALFFLDPRFWLGRSLRGAPSVEAVEQAGERAGGTLASLDDDVAAEEAEIKGRLREGGSGIAGDLEPNVAVEVRGLVRSFGSFHAVRGNFFRVETGKLFALLGPNGAGKTTTINLLTGVLPVTAGDATVCNHSVVRGGLSAIRRLMGVCPQFDILWAELTAAEHLRLFAALKGLPRAQWDATTAELLERTKLTPAAHRRSSTYSGGMKRRLSVAVALIGDPEVVYLDEPTTGMDPITRRYVWDIILEAKQGRAIVLTTHSMEEADVLADTITIIAKGRLRCFGSALRLKGKFGAGYRIAASVTAAAGGAGGASNADLARLGRSPSTDELAGRQQRMVEFFRDNLGVAPSEVGRVYTTFVVPRALEDRLAAFLSALQERKEALGVTDMQMSLTTLEQVFLLIAREAEKQAAAQDGRTVWLELPLEAGRTGSMAVAWGAEEAVFAETGETVTITWLQDDEGRLQYAHHVWRGATIAQHMDTDKGNKCCCCC